jgi:hypothetical protein
MLRDKMAKLEERLRQLESEQSTGSVSSTPNTNSPEPSSSSSSSDGIFLMSPGLSCPPVLSPPTRAFCSLFLQRCFYRILQRLQSQIGFHHSWTSMRRSSATRRDGSPSGPLRTASQIFLSLCTISPTHLQTPSPAQPRVRRPVCLLQLSIRKMIHARYHINCTSYSHGFVAT